MLFNSYVFVFLFFPITLVLYFLISKCNTSAAKSWLVLTSLYFYGYFNLNYLWIIISSILVNYSIGYAFHINSLTNYKKVFLILGVLFNLGIIGYFKYYDFFIENINTLFSTSHSIKNLLLPLGISFFTFQQLSFVIDSYNGKNLKYDFLSYCLFVTFFPQLIAGPIVLPKEMLPQFEDQTNKKVNWLNINKGFYIFVIGLSKKILIADNVAPFANTGFELFNSLSLIEGWITSLSYTVQIYFDFSGYCDMAIGIALMFNIVLPVNFNSPYRALNIQDFWKRWHITLSRFLTHYLYFPLGGNRCGNIKTFRNLIIIFLVSGLWHGASWTFIIWGALHGIFILLHRMWKHSGGTMNKYIAWFLTFNLVNILWIFFRAENLNSAISILKSMFNLASLNISISNEFLSTTAPIFGNKATLLILIFALYISVFQKYNSSDKVSNFKKAKREIAFTGILFVLSVSLFVRVAPFLYFNF